MEHFHLLLRSAGFSLLSPYSSNDIPKNGDSQRFCEAEPRDQCVFPYRNLANEFYQPLTTNH